MFAGNSLLSFLHTLYNRPYHNLIMPVEFVDLTQSPVVRTPPKVEKIDPAAVLERAIDNVSKDTLRRVVKTLCRTQPLAARFLEDQLLASGPAIKDYENVSTDEESEEDEEDEEDEEEQGTDEDNEKDDGEEEAKPSKTTQNSKGQPLAQVAGQKRMRSRFATCEQCEEEFDITENHREACEWHPGKQKLFIQFSYKPWSTRSSNDYFKGNWNRIMTVQVGVTR